MQKWVFGIRSRPFVLLSVAFLFVSLLVLYGVTDDFDAGVISYFQSVVGQPALDITMQSVTETGDVFYMFAFGVVLMVLKKTRRIGITLMILIIVATMLTGYVKCGVDRDRPGFGFPDTGFPLNISKDTFALFCEGSYNASYPSGHAARSMVFGVVLGYALSERFPRGCYLLLLYPAMISLSRLYVLHHYPMDVVGGLILGLLLAGFIAKKTKLYTIFVKSKS